MPTTSEGFYYPDSITSLSLVTILAAMAASSDAAYKKTPAVFDTIAARNAAIVTPTEGRIVYTKDYDILWHYAGGWRPVGVPTFATVGTRSLAMPSPATGDLCVVGSGGSMVPMVFNGTAWRPAGLPRVATTADRDALLVSPVVGDQCMVNLVSGFTTTYRWSGSLWQIWSRPAQNWTPTVTGVTAGLTVVNAKYAVAEGVITYYLEMQCTGALTGSALRISGLPFGLATLAWTQVGAATLNPNGSRFQGQVVRYSNANEVGIFWSGTAGTVGTEITPTVPATWSARGQAILAQWSAIMN